MSWYAPDTLRMMVAVDETWPAAEFASCGGFRLRRGAGGGKRVSAASLSGDFTEKDVRRAEAEILSMGQSKLFQLSEQPRFDDWLAADGYALLDPVTLYAAPSVQLAGDLVGGPRDPSPDLAAFWAQRGINAGRLDVMRRVVGAKICLTLQADDVTVAAAFVAVDRDIALIHALEVSPNHRRRGLGLGMMRGAAAWAVAQNVETLGLVVLSDNVAARGLYEMLGMQKCGAYHYRIKE